MGTVRKLAALLACTALLSVVGVSAAGADQANQCRHLAKVTQRIEAKQARIEARQAANAARSQGHGRFDVAAAGLAARLARLQSRCSG